MSSLTLREGPRVRLRALFGAELVVEVDDEMTNNWREIYRVNEKTDPFALEHAHAAYEQYRASLKGL